MYVGPKRVRLFLFSAVLSKINMFSPFPVYVGPKRVQLFLFSSVLPKIGLVSPIPVYVGPKGVQLFSVSTLGSPSVRAQQVVDTSMLNLCKLFNFTLMYQYCRRICHHPCYRYCAHLLITLFYISF